ncbi:hypothetical protein CCACVL1_00557 [Corchorus capsularis]|uniref:Uncharacterized protein n=1 Tax=Corchorus capsularis TaxID=210143 RepID=A0A1R3KWC7_COCAP|nr:hypothetical protein CCACVL1_00557 [Corchorus capsularis]
MSSTSIKSAQDNEEKKPTLGTTKFSEEFSNEYDDELAEDIMFEALLRSRKMKIRPRHRMLPVYWRESNLCKWGPTALLLADGVLKSSDHGVTTRDDIVRLIRKITAGVPHCFGLDDIVRWVRKSIAGVPIITLTEKDDAQHLLAADFIKVVGFYDTLEGEHSKELLIASKLRPEA